MFTVKRIVRAAVAIVLLQPWTDLEPALRRDRDVTSIEERVEVAPKKDPVLNAMRALMCERADVCRFQHRQYPFSGDRAASFVRVRHR